MVPVLSFFAWSVLLLSSGHPPPCDGSFLRTATCGPTGEYGWEPYSPHEGDLVLFDDHIRFWQIMYKLAGTAMPDHSGIVVLMNGRTVLLESGPDDGKLAGPYVRLLEGMNRLQTYQGTVHIRKLRCPLEPWQSAALTNFAVCTEGKRYASVRLVLQITPFRVRQPLRKEVFGKTDLDRRAYLCAEVVVAAGTAAGLFDPKIHRANSMYPEDLYYDSIYDLTQTWDPPRVWAPQPGQEWQPGESRQRLRR